MKKILALLLVLAMVFALAACGGGAKGAGFDITVWVPEKAVELTQQQIADFNSSNEYGIKFNATVEPVSEADAAFGEPFESDVGIRRYFGDNWLITVTDMGGEINGITVAYPMG